MVVAKAVVEFPWKTCTEAGFVISHPGAVLLITKDNCGMPVAVAVPESSFPSNSRLMDPRLDGRLGLKLNVMVPE